jgi:SOS response regulatory protein OraA/RecX
VVVGCGLRRGLELDRPLLRRLRAELRRVEAVDAAARALRHRDLSSARLESTLARRGIAPTERRRAVDSLERAGLVDDRRTAASRARALALRGYGDDAIRWRLTEEGFADDAADEALAELEPEPERARRVLELEGASDRTLRLLARRGFASDSLERLVWQSLE